MTSRETRNHQYDDIWKLYIGRFYLRVICGILGNKIKNVSKVGYSTHYSATFN